MSERQSRVTGLRGLCLFCVTVKINPVSYTHLDVYKRQIQITDVPRIVWENIRACASIIVLIGLANVFAYILTAERIPQMVANLSLIHIFPR